MLTITIDSPALGDPQLDRARDPNAEMTTLVGAATRWPREVLANPGFGLGLLVNTTPLDRLFSVDALAALVRYPEAPEVLIEAALEGLTGPRRFPQVAFALLANPTLKPQQVERTAEAIVNASDRGAPLRDRNAALDNHALLIEAGWRTPAGKADERGAREILRERLAKGELAGGRVDLSAFAPTGLLNRELGPALLSAPTSDDARRAAHVLALTPVTPPDVLDSLLDAHASPDVRVAIAENPNAYAATLERLYRVDDTNLRTQVAANPNLAAGVRQEILDAGEGAVLCGLARNPSLTGDEQLALARRDDSAVRQFLCLNPSLTGAAELEVARTADPEVARQLLRRSDLSAQTVSLLTQNSDRIVRMAASAYETKTAPKVKGAARDPLVELREALLPTARFSHRLLAATCENAPAWLLSFLAGSEDALVRLAVAAHRGTPANTRALLAVDPDVRVARAAQEPPCL